MSLTSERMSECTAKKDSAVHWAFKFCSIFLLIIRSFNTNGLKTLSSCYLMILKTVLYETQVANSFVMNHLKYVLLTRLVCFLYAVDLSSNSRRPETAVMLTHPLGCDIMLEVGPGGKASNTKHTT